MPPSAATSTEPAVDPRKTLSLARVLGNGPVRDYLARAWQRRQLPHGILLSGPDGIGKTTLAWGLVREIAANGADPETDPHALKIPRGVHPDVLEVTGSGASGAINVDAIRGLEDRVYSAPLEAPMKIVVVEQADRMQKEAANALLKLLEEPPAYLLFILITSEPGRLLDTIRSRCASLPLEPVPAGELADWLAGRARLAPEQARLIALLAEGRPGHALQLCDAKILGRRAELLKQIELLRAEGFAVLFQVAGALDIRGADLAETLLLAVALLRDALVLKTGSAAILNLDLREPLAALARDCDAEGLLAAAGLFEQAAHEVAYFYTPQARAHALEILLANVGRHLRQTS